jgi:HK97 gp10 family phage protein
MAMTWDDDLFNRVRQAALRGIVRGTERVKTTMVQSILTGPKTGRVYRRRGVEHQASAPGESPATDTGRLARSITTEYDLQSVSGRVNVSTEYAEDLEVGTPNMEARPYARPALDKNRELVQDDVASEVRRVL